VVDFGLCLEYWFCVAFGRRFTKIFIRLKILTMILGCTWDKFHKDIHKVKKFNYKSFPRILSCCEMCIFSYWCLTYQIQVVTNGSQLLWGAFYFPLLFCLSNSSCSSYDLCDFFFVKYKDAFYFLLIPSIVMHFTFPLQKRWNILGEKHKYSFVMMVNGVLNLMMGLKYSFDSP
jgi:hypothetical protein